MSTVTAAEAYERARFYLRRVRWLRAERDRPWAIADSLVEANKWRDAARAARRKGKG